MTQRYDTQKEPDGLWRIVDMFTGTAVEHDGVLLVGLLGEEADDMLDILNNP